jgi:hypothetical protein
MSWLEELSGSLKRTSCDSASPWTLFYGSVVGEYLSLEDLGVIR